MKVIVETAVALSAEQKTEIASLLKKKGIAATLEEKINPDILGGLRLNLGSKRIDLSLAGRLDQVKKQLQ